MRFWAYNCFMLPRNWFLKKVKVHDRLTHVATSLFNGLKPTEHQLIWKDGASVADSWVVCLSSENNERVLCTNNPI